MTFWNKFCGFIAIFFLNALFSGAQTIHYIKLPETKSVKKNYSSFNSLNKPDNREAVNLSRPFAVISQNYYTQHFGMMCKKELAIEKLTKIPFRFRLGSLQQCNYLEGKK
jgi:hypothetical protein